MVILIRMIMTILLSGVCVGYWIEKIREKWKDEVERRRSHGGKIRDWSTATCPLAFGRFYFSFMEGAIST